MLADNIMLLKKSYPSIYEHFDSDEKCNTEAKFTVEETKNNKITLKYSSNNQILYVHSKYDPQNEAKLIINDLEKNDIKSSETHAVFFGLGLGYQIEEFLCRFPDMSYSIIEPSFEIFGCFLNNRLLKRIFNNHLGIFAVGSNYSGIFDEIIRNQQKDIVLCLLPAYKQLFAEEYKLFFETLKQRIKDERTMLNVNYAFKERWIINSINNFKEVLKTPNILMENNGIFADKVALIVSAGPSLDYEIENLRKVKNEGLAYIFSVGSSINTLIHNDIYPHAMCTYDPDVVNHIVFHKLRDLDINKIPMIYGSSVGYETLEQYKGPKYYMITTQDTISDYFLKLKDSRVLDKVNDAASIAIVTLELLLKLGFSKIILVGQNLAFQNDRNYAEGIPYVAEKSKKTIIEKDVEGNNIETTDSYLQMKKSIEHVIKRYQASVVNTTLGGIYIEGTEFIRLSQVIDTILVKRIVDDGAFEKILKGDIYDQEFLAKKLKELQASLEVYKKIVFEIDVCLNNLEDLLLIPQKDRIVKKHVEMDKIIRSLESNEYFKVIILPLNRVEYSILVMQVSQFRNEKRPYNRALGILKPTRIFVKKLVSEMSRNNEFICVLKNIIEKASGTI